MISATTISALRGCAMILATMAGVWHIAELWFVPLSEQAMIAAGRGGILLLLALGLMGSGKLALSLVIVFCGVAAFQLLAGSHPATTVMWLEVALMAITALLLMIMLTRVPDDN